MYLSKTVLQILYKDLGDFFEHKGTLVSCFKYFIALDKFKKKHNKILEYNKQDEKNEFCDNVGEVVLLGLPKESALFTKDFSNNVVKLSDDSDFHTNGNFLSQSSCRLANNSPNTTFPYPKTNNNERNLLTALNYTLDMDEMAYLNFWNFYLNKSIKNSVLLVMWLTRFCQINDKNSYYETAVDFIKSQYTEDLVFALGLSDVSFKDAFNQKIFELEEIVGSNNLFSKEIGSLIITSQQINSSIAPSNFTPIQIILYGVPGSGKSYTINNLLDKNDISSENTMRVVFHPEYTNSDFIGQILPKLKKDEKGENVIDYQFNPGPFTKILREAYNNPETNYAFVIEEINRGNAAAIFGELFQLLDRLDEDDTVSYNGVTYTKGWSSYGVHNDCVNAFICGLYDEEGASQKKSCIHFDSNSAIRLPSNLSLFATMNTSDQNVFSLDNAFKRRWDLKLIPNKFVFDSADTKENQKQLDQCFAKIEGFDFTWGAFVNAINKKIINEQNGNDISSFEDKQIGMWFIKAISKDGVDGKVITKETFLHKVIEYLFDDVFKLEPTQIFAKSSLAELIEIAEKELRSIFVPGIITAIESEQPVLDALKGNAKLG